MVIGNGMIAKAFESYKSQDHFLIFASGVSDSTTASEAAFRREHDLIKNAVENNHSKHFVYFSTCSIYDHSLSNSPYIRHKLEIERFIDETFPACTIFRVSNPVGHTQNQSTLINFIAGKIRNGDAFEAWKNASRNVLDIDHMFSVCDDILQNGNSAKQITNVANPGNYSMDYIIRCMESHFKKKANYTWVQKGSSPVINTSIAEPIFRKLNISFGEDYFPELLQKYFPPE